MVLANDSEVVVKQVSVTGSSGSGGGLPSAIADVAGLSKLLGHLPPGAADRGVTLPVRGLSPPSASLSRRLTGLFTVVLVWILISAYGSQIAMGVGEEKQNGVDGAHRGDHLRAVHPAHRRPGPAAPGAVPRPSRLRSTAAYSPDLQ